MVSLILTMLVFYIFLVECALNSKIIKYPLVEWKKNKKKIKWDETLN